MPADVHRRPGKERCGRAGAPTRQNSGAGRPGRLRQYPTHPAQAFGASRRSVSNSDTLFMRLPAGRPAGWSAGSRKVEESGGGKPSGRKPLILRCTSAAPGLFPLHSCSVPPSKISRGEKILYGGGPAVLSSPAKTFLTGGSVRKEPLERARA